MGVFVRHNLGGPAITIEIDFPEMPTKKQAVNIRNELWLLMAEGKFPHPGTGRPHRYSPKELALLWGCTSACVRQGIAAAWCVRDRAEGVAGA